MSEPHEQASDQSIQVLDHGFVRLDDAMADDLSVVNGARVSFAKRKEEMNDADAGLIRFLMRDRHGSPVRAQRLPLPHSLPDFRRARVVSSSHRLPDGDTQITFVDINGHAHMRKTIDELVHLWEVGERDGDARAAVRRMRVRVLNEETREFTSGHIGDVIDKGVQPVYRLTLEDGKQITLTENHRVLTDSGWATMGAALGLTGADEGAQMTRDCRLLVNGQSAVAPRHVDRIDNIDVPSRKGFKLTAHAVRVVALQYVGLRQTYDLSIEGPWHNFVANGLVVHNSFNEFSMRYAKATDDFYVPEADDVRSQVGKPGAYSFEPVSQELAEETRQELEALYKEAYATYARLVEKGVARELARAVMPVGAYTQFYWTVNARALMNFVSLRNAEFAQLEIRRYAEAVEAFFAERMPITHAAFVANDRTAP